MSARTGGFNHGAPAMEVGRLWPPSPPGPDAHSETIKALIFFSFGKSVMIKAIQPSLTGELVSLLKAGKWKLPTAEETFAKINALA